jgi:hypothetical protein
LRVTLPGSDFGLDAAGSAGDHVVRGKYGSGCGGPADLTTFGYGLHKRHWCMNGARDIPG